MVGHVGVSIVGGDAIRRALDAALERLQRALAGALYQVANNVAADAQKRTPVDTGTLRGSAYVTPPEVGPNPTVEIGFGGDAKKYAGIVHERILGGSGQPIQHEVGEPKFLEKAVSAALPTLAQEIARRVERSLGPGSTPPPTTGGGFPVAPSETTLPRRKRKGGGSKARRKRKGGGK